MPTITRLDVYVVCVAFMVCIDRIDTKTKTVDHYSCYYKCPISYCSAAASRVDRALRKFVSTRKPAGFTSPPTRALPLRPLPAAAAAAAAAATGEMPSPRDGPLNALIVAYAARMSLGRCCDKAMAFVTPPPPPPSLAMPSWLKEERLLTVRFLFLPTAGTAYDTDASPFPSAVAAAFAATFAAAAARSSLGAAARMNASNSRGTRGIACDGPEKMDAPPSPVKRAEVDV